MKVTEKLDGARIKAIISFVRGVARRLGDRESLAAAQRVEIALKAMARPLAGRAQTVRQTGNACDGD